MFTIEQQEGATPRKTQMTLAAIAIDRQRHSLPSWLAATSPLTTPARMVPTATVASNASASVGSKDDHPFKRPSGNGSPFFTHLSD